MSSINQQENRGKFDKENGEKGSKSGGGTWN